jgi:hypothetical protein
MGTGKTTFKKTEVTRIMDAIAASKAKGTLEFQLASGVIRWQPDSVAPAGDGKDVVNPWDKVLKNGKAKPTLVVQKKVPR